MRALRYSLQEAVLGLHRAGRSTLMSIGTVAVAFLTLGGFLFVATNLQRVVDEWGSAAEMSVFLRDEIDEATRSSLVADLSGHHIVERAEFVSKEHAVARFKADFPELADLADGGTTNPFPASIELRLRTDGVSGAVADVLASELRGRQGVLDVRYEGAFLERLLTLVRGIRLTGLVIAGVLIVGAAFTVAAIVRLSLFARREEIDIMRLVGAPFAYLRGPSVAEGTMIGGVGALIALVALYALYRTFNLRISGAMRELGIMGGLQFLSPADAALMVLTALILGGLTGSAVARAIR